MVDAVRVTRWLLAGVLIACGVGRVLAAPCPAMASLDIVAENGSADATVSILVDGELQTPASTCSGGGVTSYAAALVCSGSGVAHCGQIDGLRPGVWVHRVRLQVAGSDVQEQSQRTLVLATPGASPANVVSWTVYPRTFVVRVATGAALETALDAAAGYTAARPAASALVTFDADAFPGAADPQVIRLRFTPRNATSDVCAADDMCTDGRPTSYCFSGSRVVVDALDRRAEPGAVVLSVGKCARSVFRLTGSDIVLRGLVLAGSEKPSPTIPVDTVAIAGAGAQRDRIERSIVRGPTLGDGVSVEDGALDATIVETEVGAAADKGVKITTGGRATVVDSCVHDNRDGGIQSTGGGAVTAVRNVVQLNRVGPAQNGILVGVPRDVGLPNALTTDGNVVRFSGARGVSVVNAATAVLSHDVISENQQAGLRIETTLPDTTPSAILRGVTLSCNYKRVTGTCVADVSLACVEDGDCPHGGCAFPAGGEPDGFGAVLGACVGCAIPALDLGTGGRGAGRNALTRNANPKGFGVNLVNQAAAAGKLPALGNQWEHCGTEATCNVPAVQNNDLRPKATAADLGAPSGPRGGPPPVIRRVVPARPRAGDFVRVYNGSLEGMGGTFNAIDGGACTDAGPTAGVPADPCSVESPAVVAQNRSFGAGNQVTVSIGGEELSADVHAVTPTMLIFRMPVDCYAPGTVVVRRGNDAASAPVTLCDPGVCADRPGGAPCDDGNACTTGERCDGNGACVATGTVTCGGPCETGVCDPERGCVLADTAAMCDDGNACTADRCVAAAACMSSPVADGTRCPELDRCHGAATCQAGVCDGGRPLVCDDGDFCTDDSCDPAAGCRYAPVTGIRRSGCRVDELRALLAALPEGGGRIGRRLARRLDGIAKALGRVESAHGKRRARRARGKARAALRAFVGAVRSHRRVLGAAAGRQLTRSAKTAIANLTSPDA